MKKKAVRMAVVLALFSAAIAALPEDNPRLQGSIKRLTFSGNNIPQFPCLSSDGRWMLYVLEIKDGDNITKTVRIMDLEDGKEKELFRSGTMAAPAPFNDTSLHVGSKPPALSGNGRVAVFAMSLGEPVNILDHYLAVVNTDGTDFSIIGFSIEALREKDLKSLDITSGDWERLSAYTLNDAGDRAACVVKGHLGPIRYGNPSGLIFLDIAQKKQRTILAPGFVENQWKWRSFPRQPLTGGGWAFGMDANGDRVVFGAQSSEDKTDYDLYTADWDRQDVKRLTKMSDRWFSLAEVSDKGDKAVFFYNGSKEKGMGTYTINMDGSQLLQVQSKVAPRVEFCDMSGNGRYVIFKHIYKGMIIDLQNNVEMVAFDENTPGYVPGLMPMDFPRFPAFWPPRIMSTNAEKILLVGPPQGKENPEIYMLGIQWK